MKKAFTLVELLAVIVILAIISLISAPLVLQTIKDSEISAAEISAYNYIEEVKKEIIKQLKYGKQIEGQYTIKTDGNLCKGTDIKNCKEEIKINISGNKPTKGKIATKNGKISTIGTYVTFDEYNIAYKGDQLILKTYLLTNDINLDGNADIGDLITIGTESFYVYSNDGKEIKALAKYNLNVGNVVDSWKTTPLSNATGLQDEQMLGYTGAKDQNNKLVKWYGTVEFSNSTNVYNDSTIKKHVNNYANKLKKLGADKITVRLITAKELNELGVYDSSSLKNLPEEKKFINSTSYWTSTPANDTNIRYITVTGMFAGDTKYTADNFVGVRPVVVIPVSEI